MGLASLFTSHNLPAGPFKDWRTNYDTEGRREVLGLATSEAETFWTDFLCSFTHRDLRGVKLVVSDAHEDGLKAVSAKVAPSGSAAACTS